jgi:7-cyano-7-deazaguanine synthase
MTTPTHAPLAVLVSGGLDSAVLLGTALREHSAVHPLYIRAGLAWEPAEQQCLAHFLAELSNPALRPIVTLEMPVADLYGDHWSLTGRAVPGNEAPDIEVYLPGRNVLLLAKALIWCHLNDVPTLALASLAGNPFADATPEFFRAYAAAVNTAVGGQVEVVAPYLGLTKAEVIRRGWDLPLQYTMSCLNPTAGRHCGHCNKCGERQAAFVAAGVVDPTDYGAPNV